MKKFSNLILAAFLVTITLNLVLAVAQGQDVELEYRTSAAELKAGDEFAVDLVLKNPAKQNIISVRSWMEYNPAELEGIVVDTSKSSFTLAAPGEDGFDAENKWVKLGRSNISGGVRDPEVTVAILKFRVRTQNGATAKIKPYDYQVSELGHVSVNIIEDGFPANVLAREPKELVLNLNGGAGAAGGSFADQNIYSLGGQPAISSLLSRPTDLKANTGSGYVDLMWDGATDQNRSGFYVYYGKTSGEYYRRRDISNASQARIENLPNGETYFFAVTAYGQDGSESDYSDEAGIIVGEPLSSTSPFSGLLQATLGRLPSQPANGPLAWWILFSAIGLSGAILFRNKLTHNNICQK